MKSLDEVLSRFRFANLTLKPGKCLFANDNVDYLGFQITDKGIRPTSKKIEAILRIEPPETTRKLYSFLWSINYYRSLIPNFGEVSYELYQVANLKRRTVQWTESLFSNFATLKNALVSAPVLSFPDYNLPFLIQSDASKIAIGAVLLQKSGNLFRPVAFASRKLSETEQNYSASERKLLALVYAYEEFFSHVYGRPITFYTDHEPLATMQKFKKPMGRLGRLFHRLQDIDYKIVYLPGEENFLPDFLSRSYAEPSSCDANAVEIHSKVDWRAEQVIDEELAEVIRLIKTSAPEP